MSKAVYEKINLVSKAIGVVEKDARNSFHNYVYQSWESVLVAVKSACNAHGLVILPAITDITQIGIVTTKGGEKQTVLVAHDFNVCDSDSGESVTLSWVGQATLDDDKSINKAGTAAYKYFVLKLFQITVKGDDTDTDAHHITEPVKTSAPTQSSASTSGYELPLKAAGLDRAKKKAKENGIDWNVFVAECEKQKAGNVAVCGEILDGLIDPLRYDVAGEGGAA